MRDEPFRPMTATGGARPLDVGTIQIRKGGTLVSWLFLRPGTAPPRLLQAFRTHEETGRAVVSLGANLTVTFDSAEIARALAAACTGAAEALDRLNAEADQREADR